MDAWTIYWTRFSRWGADGFLSGMEIAALKSFVQFLSLSV